MPRLPVLLLAVLALWLAAAPPARADDFAPPGLSSDAEHYASELHKRAPAGGSAAGRLNAEAQAAAALGKSDWPALASALETRISLGQETAEQWLDLANAALNLSPPQAKKAVAAAWKAYTGTEEGPAQVPPLKVLAQALRTLARLPDAVLALERAEELAPDDEAVKHDLTELRKLAGLFVRKLQTEAEADPPRACLTFSVAPVRRSDFNAPDWVKLDPPQADAAVTREGDQICVSGLTAGARASIVLRAGLPGEDGLSLPKDITLAVTMPNRPPTIAFDTRLFVLPRGQTPQVTLTTVNVPTVALKLYRLTERNIPALLREVKLGDPVERWTAEQVAGEAGSVVWQGRAEVPHWNPNKTLHTALPFPEPLATAGPGLYALLADSPSNSAAAVQLILRTDLAPTVWRGSDGLTVQMRSYADARVQPGTRLQLLAHNNDILGETVTDADGVARFAAPLLHGEGPLEPAVLHAFGADGDFAALDLNAAAFDLSDRGVAGAEHPGPLDAFVWLDRGIYRPGETVQVMALLRDDAGRPADIPARVTIKRPNGQVFLRATPQRAAEASLHLPVKLSNGAAVGTWTVDVQADPEGPSIGHAEFRVDAFVPDRMAVDLGKLPAAVVPGTATDIPLVARFLYGAPGAGLTGKASYTLNPDPTPFPAFAAYHFGLIDEAYAPTTKESDLAETDAQGATTYSFVLDRAPDTTRPLKADLFVEVDDPSGHGSRAAAALPVRGAGPLLGIRPGFADNAVNAGSEAAFDIVALTPDGTPTALAAKLRLVRERPDWRLVLHERVARYEEVYRDEPLETRDIAIAADKPLHFAKTLDWGRYRIEVTQPGGLVATSYRFRSGWADTDSPDVPDRVDISTTTRTVPAGQSAKIHITPPFAGEATLLVLSDRVLSLRTLPVAEAGTDVEVPVDASWGPGAYVAVHLYRAGGTPSGRPQRAIGLTWVGVDPAARTLPLALDLPEKFPPRARATIKIKTAPAAWVSLAAIDEGILRLTRFVSPDPAPHFLGRRRLGLDIRDDWGRLLAPADGESALLKQGGDEGSFVLPDIPQRTVTLFTPPVQADADGNLAIPLDLPDFNGQVRLMAVGWSGSRIGAASGDVLVRDPLVVEALLPRFLAPGDEARLSVLLHNLDLPTGEAAVALSIDGPLALAGPTRLAATLEPGAQALPAATLRGTGAGRGVLHMDVTGPAGFHLSRDVAITVRPARGRLTSVAGAEIAPGAEQLLKPDAGPADFIPGTWHLTGTFGAPVRYDTAALVQSLTDYPWSCLEQATSRGLPLAMLPDGPAAGDLRLARLQEQVQSVLDRQRYDGGFALWSASGDAEPWLSAYATDFLLRAKAGGALVPDTALAEALKFLADGVDSSDSDAAALAVRAYDLYVLAKGDHGHPGAVRVLAEHPDTLPTPLARAQIAAALALAHDQPHAEALFAAALADMGRRWWWTDYGSTLRDEAATVVLLKESGLLSAKLAKLVGLLPGATVAPEALTTQEDAWLAAAAAALGRDGRAVHIALGGTEQPATAPGKVLTKALGEVTPIRNLGDKPVWASLAISGVPVQAAPAARSHLRVSRRFYTLDGQDLNLDHLTQNTVFVLLLEGKAEDGNAHYAMAVQGLPAGWEIAGRIAGGKASGLPWLGELTEPEAQPAADDRFAAVLALTAEKPSFRIAVRVRAVTQGEFELPGAELADMYAPGNFARQNTGRIKILGAE